MTEEKETLSSKIREVNGVLLGDDLDKNSPNWDPPHTRQVGGSIFSHQTLILF